MGLSGRDSYHFTLHRLVLDGGSTAEEKHEGAPLRDRVRPCVGLFAGDPAVAFGWEKGGAVGAAP